MDNRRDYTELLEELKVTVEEQIKVTVNGKIDRLTGAVEDVKKHLEKQDEILKQLQPVRDGLAWFDISRKFITYIAAIVIALTTIYGAIRFIIPKGTITFSKTSLSKEDVQEIVETDLENREFQITK